VLTFFLLWCIGSVVMAQSKIYVAGGLSNVFGTGANLVLGDENYGGKFSYFAFDVEYQKRIIGSFNAVGGISVFTAGYNATDNSFSANSKFDATYIAIPLMARWNVGNLNYVYIDLGPMPYYLVKAHLKESVVRFNQNYTVEGDITQYSNRFYYAFKFQFLVLINRFYFGMYAITPPKGQSTLKDLEGHWGLNAQESTYLLSNGLSDYSILGLKLGVRIK
jgi:hypothetical protein